MAAFAEALSRAVEASGLSLERIQRHLELRGVQVSLSTLSYWRRGRSRPERPESLHAVAALEEILRLASGELTGKLGDKRPRGRWVERAAALEGIWQEAAIDLGRAIARVVAFRFAPSCSAAAPATSGAAIDVPLLDSVAMSLTRDAALTNLDRSGPPVPGR